MPELPEVKLERELKSDLAWLRLKAARLRESLALTEYNINKIERQLRSYPLPDGRTR